MFYRLTYILSFLFLSACQSAVVTKSDYLFSVVNIDSGFEVELENLSNHEICLVPGVWPNADGYTGDVEYIPAVELEGRKYRYEKRYSAIGHLNRLERIASGETKSLNLMYADFEGLPLEAINPRLIFEPIPISCNHSNFSE